jgi:hypothetical protein
MERKIWNVEILHKDSHCTYNHMGVLSVHEEGSYTVLVKNDGTILKFPTVHIWRLKCKEIKE